MYNTNHILDKLMYFILWFGWKKGGNYMVKQGAPKNENQTKQAPQEEYILEKQKELV